MAKTSPVPPPPPTGATLHHLTGAQPRGIKLPTSEEMAQVSCLSCPSLIAPDDLAGQRRVAGQPTGAALCGRYALPVQIQLGIGDALPRMLAWLCSHRGEKMPPEPLPAPEHLRILADRPTGVEKTPPGGEKPLSCHGCAHFLTPARVRDQLGFPLGLCSVDGLIVPTGRAMAVAKDCATPLLGRPDRVVLTPSDLGEGWRDHVTVIPVDGSPVSRRVQSSPEIVEPSTYPTDAEVSAEDTARGIRAWRSIADPQGKGEPVLLPVFDAAFFDDIDRSKIPVTGDDEHPELYRDHLGLLYTVAVLWRHLGETPALNGQAGSGKTTLFRYAAWIMQLPFERVSVTNSTELDDLAGRATFSKEEGTGFAYGRIPLAWGRPCVLTLDEPNVGPPDVWQFIRPLTDTAKQLVLDMNRGERIAKHEHCFFGMSFNPAWDMRNVGAHEIGAADSSRLMHIAVPAPDDATEREIIVQRCAVDGYAIDTPTVDALLGIAADLRGMYEEDTLPIHWGVREQVKVARNTRWFDLERSYRLAAGDFLDPQACEMLLAVVKSHDGSNRPSSKKNKNGAIPAPF